MSEAGGNFATGIERCDRGGKGGVEEGPPVIVGVLADGRLCNKSR